MGITVDTIQLKFNVTPSYQQQQIQQLNADLKQATANNRRIRLPLMIRSCQPLML
jgi:hypothetical protein